MFSILAQKFKMIDMKNTSIQISKETWKKLAKLRIDFNQKTFDDVIKMLLKKVKS